MRVSSWPRRGRGRRLSSQTVSRASRRRADDADRQCVVMGELRAFGLLSRLFTISASLAVMAGVPLNTVRDLRLRLLSIEMTMKYAHLCAGYCAAEKPAQDSRSAGTVLIALLVMNWRRRSGAHTMKRPRPAGEDGLADLKKSGRFQCAAIRSIARPVGGESRRRASASAGLTIRSQCTDLTPLM